MLRNCKGFSLLEHLISLTLMFFLIFSFLPQFIQIEQQRHNIKLINIANHLIQQELNEYIHDGVDIKNTTTITVENTAFTITWNQINQDTINICASWENAQNKQEERCGYAKR